MTERPKLPQGHPAMRVARNIVNQILDESGADIDTRQRINDDCDQFVAWMLDRYAARRRVSIEMFECPRCAVVAYWTGGIERGGNEPAEYWCQNCGAESLLTDCTHVGRETS